MTKNRPIGSVTQAVFYSLLFLGAGFLSTDASVIRSWDGESGSAVSFSTADDGEKAKSTTAQSYEGGSAIISKINTNSNSVTDRSDWRMSSCSGSMFGSSRYVGFAIRFTDSVTHPPPSNFLVIHQWRQCTSGATPPVKLELEKEGNPGSGKVSVVFSARADSDPLENGDPAFSKKLTLNRNQWYTMVV